MLMLAPEQKTRGFALVRMTLATCGCSNIIPRNPLVASPPDQVPALYCLTPIERRVINIVQEAEGDDEPNIVCSRANRCRCGACSSSGRARSSTSTGRHSKASDRQCKAG